MNHENFIIASYVVGTLVMGWLIISSYAAMRKSEALADDLREQS